MPPVISFVGKAESGKTTLLEKLIPELRRRGFRIGILKHHVHEFVFDSPGKDTWRHRQAGASTVVLSSPTGIGLIEDTDIDQPASAIVERFFQKVDLVITEGYKHESFPKLEVFRSANLQSPLANRDKTWIAMVSDIRVTAALPHFDLDDITGLADFLEDQIRKDFYR